MFVNNSQSHVRDLTLFFLFQVEYYMTYRVKFARITLPGNITEYLHAMDVLDFLNGLLEEAGNMYAKPNRKERV